MNIRKDIGNRITTTRKEAGFSTIKELSEISGLKPARISNWEQGTRMPGPEEIKELAKLLNVSPAYLLCLSDDKYFGMPGRGKDSYKKLPILLLSNQTSSDLIIENIEDFVLIESQNLNMHSNLIAIKIEDASMSPEFVPGDLIIIDTEKNIEPGKNIVAYLKLDNRFYFRKYIEKENMHSDKTTLELVPQNKDWAMKTINSIDNIKILGMVVEHRRYF